MLTVVAQLGNTDRVVICRSQPTLKAPERQVVLNRDRPEVEEDMVVRAEAQDVVRRIQAVVRGAERLDVGGLRIRPDRGEEALAADLAAEVVVLLDPRRRRRVVDDPGDRRGPP